jgi:hypothetical protein
MGRGEKSCWDKFLKNQGAAAWAAREAVAEGFGSAVFFFGEPARIANRRWTGQSGSGVRNRRAASVSTASNRQPMTRKSFSPKMMSNLRKSNVSVDRCPWTARANRIQLAGCIVNGPRFHFRGVARRPIARQPVGTPGFPCGPRSAFRNPTWEPLSPT